MEDTTYAIPFLLGLGAITGILSGLLGIGGGLVIVPVLIIALPALGIDAAEAPKIAAATSLATVVPVAFASAQAQAQKGNVDWYLWFLLMPAIIGGAVLTATYAGGLDAWIVVLAFIVFALYSASRLLRGHQTQAEGSGPPRLAVLTPWGLLSGAVSTLLGISPATMVIPYLARSTTLRRAIGTAAALSPPMALAGTIAYLAAPPACPTCVGFVYLPAVAAIAITAVLAAPIGVLLAHALPVSVLKRSFAVVLILAAGDIAYKTFSPSLAMELQAQLAATAKHLVSPETPALRPSKAPLWIGGRNVRQAGQYR